jgi:hypothetical protein
VAALCVLLHLAPHEMLPKLGICKNVICASQQKKMLGVKNVSKIHKS